MLSKAAGSLLADLLERAEDQVNVFPEQILEDAIKELRVIAEEGIENGAPLF